MLYRSYYAVGAIPKSTLLWLIAWFLLIDQPFAKPPGFRTEEKHKDDQARGGHDRDECLAKVKPTEECWQESASGKHRNEGNRNHE